MAVRTFTAGLPATFWWLAAGALIMALATFVFPFLALFLTARGFSVEQTGLIVALFGGGTILAGPAAGSLADRIGRRPTLLASLVGAAALTALLGVLSSTTALAAVTLALGLVANAFRPVANATVADLVAPEERARAYGLLYWGNNAGLALSFVVGGTLASHGYAPLFLADAATTLLFAALVWWKVPETRPPVPVTGSAPFARGGLAALADRPFLALLGLNVAFLLLFCQHQLALPLDMAHHGF